MLVGTGALLPILAAWLTGADAWRARSWTETSCSIERIRVVAHPRPRGRPDSYTIDVRYRYSTPSGERAGTRLNFPYAAYNHRRDAEAVAERYPAGSVAACYYAPDNPAESVIDRSWDSGGWLTWGTAAAFALAGAFVVRVNRRRR